MIALGIVALIVFIILSRDEKPSETEINDLLQDIESDEQREQIKHFIATNDTNDLLKLLGNVA